MRAGSRRPRGWRDRGRVWPDCRKRPPRSGCRSWRSGAPGLPHRRAADRRPGRHRRSVPSRSAAGEPGRGAHGDRLQAPRHGERRGRARPARGFAFDRVNHRVARQPEREGADAGKEVGDRFAFARCAVTRPAIAASASATACRKAPAAGSRERRPPRSSAFWVRPRSRPRPTAAPAGWRSQTGWPAGVVRRERRYPSPRCRGRKLGCRDQQPEGIPARRQDSCQFADQRNRARDRRHRYRVLLDVDDVVRHAPCDSRAACLSVRSAVQVTRRREAGGQAISRPPRRRAPAGAAPSPPSRA
jgi:hypothetical protein